jgi:hypothetical protein
MNIKELKIALTEFLYIKNYLYPCTSNERPTLIYNAQISMVWIYEMFEDTKVTSRIRKSKKDRQYNGQKKKDRQYNGQKKKDRQYNGRQKKYTRTNDDLQSTTQKTKDLETRTPLKPEGEHRCSGRTTSSCSKYFYNISQLFLRNYDS